MNNSTDAEESYFNPSFLISMSARFWIYLISNILSILCSLFVLYYLLFDRTLRQALNNHVIIILLILGLVIELIDIPFILHFYLNNNWKVTHLFSSFWSFIDYNCITTQVIIFAWTTIERHIFIFHDQWMSTRKKRFFAHYLPITFLLIYCFIYYLIIVIYPYCLSENFQSPIVGVFIPCIYDNTIIIQYDLIVHCIIPTFIIVLFSITLLLRVLWQKTRLHQAIQWRRQRKLIIQTLSISILYFLFFLPWMIIQLTYQINLLKNVGIKMMAYTIFFSYYTIFLFPFVCCQTMPELKKI